jgi:flavin reductase (DIM6/NTAB) family NADH-FMN oxidoreductase RutF
MVKKRVPINVSVGHLVAPKPTALVTCQDTGGKANIIAIAAITIVSHRPPIFMIAIREDRFSHDLITNSGEFVINMPTADQVEVTHLCGRISGRTNDKFQASKLTPIPASEVSSPLIRECPINIECKVVGTARPGTHTLFFGEAVAVHVEADLFDGVKIDLTRFPTILFNYTEYRAPTQIIKQLKK